MKQFTRMFWILVWSATLAGCIQVELKDERTIPKLYEVALVTYTPEGWSPDQPTATRLPPTPTLMPSATATSTPTPSATNTPAPSSTPVRPTPTFTAALLYDTWCKEGPGTTFSGIRFLVVREQVTLLGRNDDASWWWVQPSQEDLSCWIPSFAIDLPQPAPALPVINAQAQTIPLQTTPLATKKSRPKPANPTAGPSDTPNPYPNPYPYPAP